MPRRKAGLQKEFSAIFQDVWIPTPKRFVRPSRASTPQPPREDPRQIREMEEIALRIKCAKDFECFRSGFNKLCKARIVGDGKLLECSPQNRGACEFRFCFAARSFCKCPLRYHIAKNLHK